jgi:hypothetical protein
VPNPNIPKGFPAQNLPPIFKHFWLAFIAVSIVNQLIAWRNLPDKAKADPELRGNYLKVFAVGTLVVNIPWLLMGYFILRGQAASMFDFLTPSLKNPAVLLWWECMAGFLAIGTLWIFMGGAELLAQYPGLFMIPVGGASKIKKFWLISLAGSLLGGGFLFFWFPYSMHQGAWKIFDERFDEFIPFLFPFFFVGMWLLVGWSLAQFGGWSSLAESYRAEGPFEGKKFSGMAGRMGMSRYKGVLILGADNRGLFLSVIFLFRFSHPALFIPWTDITASEKKGFFYDSVSLEFAKAPGIVLQLRKQDVLKLKEQAESLSAFAGID